VNSFSNSDTDIDAALERLTAAIRVAVAKTRRRRAQTTVDIGGTVPIKWPPGNVHPVSGGPSRPPGYGAPGHIDPKRSQPGRSPLAKLWLRLRLLVRRVLGRSELP
jgi:hypothetical protein